MGELLEARTLLTFVPQLVADINPSPAGVPVAGSIVEMGGYGYFASGSALWRSDGTTAGTSLIREIADAGSSGSISGLTNINATLFFAANDGINGLELWKSDGTAAGTMLIKDIAVGAAASTPRYLTNVSGRLFFRANDDIHGTELWTSDGTAEGTVLIQDVNPGAADSKPSNLTAVGGKLFFIANDGTNGNALWRSDGTPDGTLELSATTAAKASTITGYLANLNGTLYFPGIDSAHGAELWRSDGTIAGTTLVADIRSAGSSSNPQMLVAAGSNLFFRANDGVHGYELWKSDGTAAGTMLVKDISVGSGSSIPSSLVNLNGKLLFEAGFNQLWASDGTSAGTQPILTSTNPALSLPFPNDLPAIVNGVFYCQGRGTNQTNAELWRTDGTANGTYRVKDIVAGSSGSYPNGMANINGRLLFYTTDGVATSLWASDGTDAGTQFVGLDNAATAPSVVADPKRMAVVGGELFVAANDGSHGRELWKSDGTAAGTSLVKDINPGPGVSSLYDFVNVNGKLLFTSAFNLWISDGSSDGTGPLTDPNGIQQTALLTPVEMDGDWYYISTDEVLHKTDGTPSGTSVIKPLTPFAPTSLTVVGDTIFFTKQTSSTDEELWKSDGTSGGTVLVRSFPNGRGVFFYRDLTNLNGTLFFAEHNDASGTELWESDGTLDGTRMVKDIFPGAGNSTPTNLANINGTLYFTATDGIHGNELWKSDGTPDGTVLVKDIAPGSADSNVRYLIDINGKAFFRANDGTTGDELWTSDGTEAGTGELKDIRPGPLPSRPANLVNIQGHLFFAATDGVHGSEIWTSDGTANGTVQLPDIAPGAASSVPGPVFVLADRLIVLANDGTHGNELWALIKSPPVAVDDSYETPGDAMLASGAPGVLHNDDDSDSYPLSARLRSNPTHGTLDLHSDGSFTYQPIANYSGPDTFTYQVSNSLSVSNVATVAIVVDLAPDASMAGQMLLDINQTSVGLSLPSTAMPLSPAGKSVYFGRNDGVTGTELWKSDGTGAGSGLVKDIRPGSSSGFLTVLGEAGGKLFLNANDGTHGPELWVTDGTALGTVMVKDINPGSAGSGPSNAVAVNGTLFFSATDGTNGIELWTSDGTATGTLMVKDLVAGSSSSPHYLVNANGTLFFFAAGSLWTSDGTAAGTVPLKTINAKITAAASQYFTAVGGTLFFRANDGSHGYELWKSDGTPNGTVLVKDIADSAADSNPRFLTNVNGMLYFQATDAVNGSELWKSDGSETGTTIVSDIQAGTPSSSPANLTNVAGTLFFAANDGSHGFELWKSDGSTAGTVMVRDILPGLSNSAPFRFVNVNGTLFFMANGGHSYELWRSDGTANGTTLLRGKNFDNGYTTAAYLTNVAGTLFFRDRDVVSGSALWKSDGTAAGTMEVPRDAVSTLSAFPGGLEYTTVGPLVEFYANDGVHGPGLWKTDGTAGGTSFIAPMQFAENLTNVNGTLFFRGYDPTNHSELWKSDGTAAGTTIVKDISAAGGSYPGGLTNFNGLLVFKASRTGELWASDGTPEGTTKIKSIRVGSGDTPFFNFNGSLYFAGNDGIHGYELWKSDGTADGTVMISDSIPGSYGSGPGQLTNVNGTLFFTALDPVWGRQLWKSDGTAAGTVEVKILNSVQYFPRFKYMENVNGRLFFSCDDGSHGFELWTSDGTADGTVMLKDIMKGENGSNPQDFFNVNGVLTFIANDGVHGTELWRSDGTPEGTVLLKDVTPTETISDHEPRDFSLVNGTLFFDGYDAAHGFELWHTDGTAAGTALVDVRPGTNSSLALGMGVFSIAGRVLFNANDGVHGNELFQLLDVNGAPSGADETITVSQNASFTFSELDFGFRDPNDSPPNQFAGVKITFLPPITAGSLELAGSAVVAGQFITVTDIRAGLLTFAPAENASGNPLGSIGFQVKDDGGIASGGVDLDPSPNTITINVPNRPPLARDDVYFIAAGGSNDPTWLDPWGVISNDVDFDGPADDDHMQAILLDPPRHGQLQWNPTGIFTYTPDANFIGTDSFTYQDDDGHLDNHLSNVATVTLHVTPADSVPADQIVVNDESYTTKLNTPLVVSYPGMLANDFSTHGNTIWTLHGQSPDFLTNLVVQFEVDGSFIYTPPSGFIGQTSFSYDVYDGEGVAARMGTVTLRVTADGDHPPTTPTFNADLALLEDQSLTIPQADLLQNATDPDGDTVRVKIVTPPVHGTLSMRKGDLLYTPAADYAGPDGFSYVANDGQLDSSANSLTLQISPVNDPPTFTAVTAIDVTDESGPQSNGSWVHDIAAGPPDESQQNVHFVITNISNPGLFSVPPEFDPTNHLIVMPTTNVSGSSDVSFYLQDDGGTDGGGLDVSETVTITINVTKPHPWHNAAWSADVTGDGKVVAQDVVDLINYINGNGSGPVAMDGSPVTLYYDVTGDNHIAADDVVAVINYINAHPQVQPEAEAPLPPGLARANDALFSLLAADAAAQTKKRR